MNPINIPANTVPICQISSPLGGQIYYPTTPSQPSPDLTHAIELSSFYDPETRQYRAWLTPVSLHIATSGDRYVVHRDEGVRILAAAYSPRYVSTSWNRFTAAATDIARAATPDPIQINTGNPPYAQPTRPARK